MAIVISGVNNNDKITAADGLIDILSGVSFASTITAPGFSATNNLTAASINVGSNIQLGNAGVATATTFVGNLTGNVNATSNLLLQIGGSEKFRVGSSGQLGIGGANYGTSGQVLTSGGSGSAATWSTITGTTINNNAANRIITGEGGTTLNGEANLTFDGSKLSIKGVDTATGSGGPSAVDIKQGDANNEFVNLSLQTGSGGPLAVISAIADATGVYPNTTGQLRFSTQVGGGLFERMFIKSNGDIGLGESSPNRSGYSSPVTSIGYNTGNGYGVLELLGNKTSDSAIANIVAYNIGGSSRVAAIAFERSGANNSGAIRFETYTSGSSAERMRISKEGYVTKPAHPSFCARYSNGEANSYSSGDVIKLTLVAGNYLTWDTTSSYSTSTGKFTAPVAGVYYFEGQLMTTGHSNGDNIQDLIQLRSSNGLISHPRQRRSTFRSHAEANGYFTNSCAGQTKLSSGDTVWIQANRTLGVLNTNYSYFTGWLIG